MRDDDFDRQELMRATVRLIHAERETALARLNVERELAKWHGRERVRGLARRSCLSAATISNLFRGRLVVSAEHLRDIVRLLPDAGGGAECD